MFYLVPDTHVAMKIFRWLIIAQSTYTMITAIWPLIDIHSFMLVTGYKTDIWLVKTVGVLLIPIAATQILFLIIQSDPRVIIFLSSLVAVAFIIVDCVYALSDVISDIYLVDAGIQVIFLIAWIYVVIRIRSTKTSTGKV
jgi:hypothetical protein